ASSEDKVEENGEREAILALPARLAVAPNRTWREWRENLSTRSVRERWEQTWSVRAPQALLPVPLFVAITPVLLLSLTLLPPGARECIGARRELAQTGAIARWGPRVPGSRS